MNKDKLKKNIFHRVKLRPIAKRIKRSIESEPIDDDWIIEQVTDDGVVLKNTRTDHFKLLGFDHIHHYTSDPSRDYNGLKHGILTMTVQLYLDEKNVRIEPISLKSTN